MQTHWFYTVWPFIGIGGMAGLARWMIWSLQSITLPACAGMEQTWTLAGSQSLGIPPGVNWPCAPRPG
jgi:hypothetical protein